jgi:putative ABC transport system ATP-binding protein
VPSIEYFHRTLSLGGRDLHVLGGVSFTVGAGEWLALSGPFCSGKSTLSSLLAGMDRSTYGRICVAGEEISSLPESQLAPFRNQKIGVVFQSFHLFPNMNAQKNVEASLYICPSWRRASSLACQMLEQVDLGDCLYHSPISFPAASARTVCRPIMPARNSCHRELSEATSACNFISQFRHASPSPP